MNGTWLRNSTRHPPARRRISQRHQHKPKHSKAENRQQKGSRLDGRLYVWVKRPTLSRLLELQYQGTLLVYCDSLKVLQNRDVG